jgi:chromosome partitioning protein
MSVPVLAFFNNKGGVGKTSLAYHLAWIFADIDFSVLVCDLDPQANLTAAFLDDEKLANLFDSSPDDPVTVFRCLQPLTEVGDVKDPVIQSITPNLALLPGDLGLATFEDLLSREWYESLGQNRYRPFRVLTAFWQMAQAAAKARSAQLILLDVGPNLGAINRSALVAADFVLVPLGADLFSLQGLRNLGPTFRRWREEWGQRLANWTSPAFDLPQGGMWPIGYVVQQNSVRLSKPVRAYDRWVKRIPGEYRRSILGEAISDEPMSPENDPHCLATLKHYRSLMPLAQEARKPVFHLTVADGAIGSHSRAVQDARSDFELLASAVLSRIVPLTK